MAELATWIDTVTTALFLYLVVPVLLLTGLILTIRLAVVQLRRLPEAFRAMMAQQSKTATGGSLSPFQAFMTALGASIGTGNIAGVATAIISGGPGALFWIWVYGFVATAIKFSEAVLGVRFRLMRGSHSLSGPMYYLRDGLKSPALAWTYALVAGVAALTTTPFTQPNSIAVALESVFHIPTWIAGIVIAVLVWVVIIGGINSIGRAAEKLAPLKVFLYLAGGLIVIVTHAANLPDVFAAVVRDAFSLKAAAGTTAGVGVFMALRYGIARGVYANEAGYGTAAVAYGTAKTADPSQQGLQAVMEVFIVSFVTSTISALTILVSGVAQQSIATINAGGEGVKATAAVAAAFNTAMPTFGGWIVAFCAFLFGYTTLIGWAYYGEQFLEYILGRRVTLPYRWIYCLLIPVGATLKVDLVWNWGDLMNALQVFPNVVGLIGLSGIAAAYARSRSQTSQ
ncbi:MAG TPA: amino acid carrier protein [Vicinamibacterales bacterium]|nr:amino acid carrier protein [Vicinamibacterales bacterium]